MTGEPSGSRGRLRVYLGIAPGVGKTYAMFRDARAEHRHGVDTVVAYWERHGRAATAAQLGGLELLPTRTVPYRGTTFEELDLDGVLARHPALALVDELAHANLPGERHERRFEDVEELLANGIDVYTTLNVANIESLGHLVSQITGTPPAEAVPDSFVRSAEVNFITLEPAALRHRLSQGFIFPSERVDTALANYFRYANLAALQELADLWLDETVPDPAKAYRSAHGLAERREVEVVVVAIGGAPSDEWLIHYADELATLNKAELRGLHVRTGDRIGRRLRAQLDTDRSLLQELHGAFTEVDADEVSTGLIESVRKIPGAQLVIGSPGGPRRSWRLRSSTVGHVIREAGDLPLQVVNVGRPPATAPHVGRSRSTPHRGGSSSPPRQ